MSLYAEPFERVKRGEKTREYRLYDEKRQKVRVGDTIAFYRLPDKTESVTVVVKGLRRYADWHSCYAEFFEADLSERYGSIEEAVQATYDHWWPKEKEEEYGCLVIEIERVEA